MCTEDISKLQGTYNEDNSLKQEQFELKGIRCFPERY